jgi:hypothetical protein
MSLPLFLKPKKNFNLIRLGKDNDGGYLAEIESIKNSKYLLSLGIYDDWSFEKDFLEINKNLKIFCYDASVSASFFFKKIVKNLVFVLYFGIKKLIKSIQLFLSFKNFFSDKNFCNHYIYYNDIIKIVSEKKLTDKIFLKIDIEGSEYRILKDLVEIREKICGICIEFHDIDLHLDKIEKFIREINLDLVHIHPNNFGRKDLNNNPTVIEVTFAKKPVQNHDVLSLPNVLDHKNNPEVEDIKIDFC